jgi:hypothetical protein
MCISPAVLGLEFGHGHTADEIVGLLLAVL